jgi:4-amino-4-deoxy-L-arabinose transferase-like glycosyltransferase
VTAGALMDRPPFRAPAWPAASWRRALDWVRAHPDLVLLTALVLVAIVARGVLLTRAPLFLRRDSVAYYQVGWEAANGLGFDLPLRRTPLYPLFIAGVVWTLGEDLRGLALAQHLLGIVTVVATYFLGRAMFGRLAGALAALAIAPSAPLLIYEHYILAEPLFIPLLTLGLLLVVLALRRDVPGARSPIWLYLAGGLVLALAALSRPIGQALLPVAPLAILAHHWRPKQPIKPGLRASVRPILVVLLGFALILVPWSIRGSFTTGKVSGAGALGQSLIGRIIRHDEGFVLPAPNSPSPYADPRKTEIRSLILTQMNRDARPSAINHRIQEVYGLSEQEADAALRAVAIEIFTSQPGRYAEGTLAKFRRLLVGEDERLRVHWATRKDGELRDAWTDEEDIAHLYSPPSPIQEREYPTAEAVTRIFQPYLWRWLLIPLVLLGLGWGLVRGPRGPTVLLVLTTLALVFPSAALVGYVPRYRYPADPLLAVLAAGGIVALLALAGLARRRVQTRTGVSGQA